MRRMNVSRIASAAAISLVCAMGFTLTGCNKKAKTGEPANGEQAAVIADGDYLALYQARRFSEAKAAADAAAPKLQGRNREVAVLTSGLAAHAMGDAAEARRLLMPLTSSKDPQIAGRAEACLGQIAQRQGQHGYAANLLGRAADKLDGDDAAQANVRAGNSLTKMGQHGQAITHYREATEEATSTGLKQLAAKQSTPGPFAVQAGVFSSKANADARARQLQTTAMRFGYGLPRVVNDTVNGRPAFAVQVGIFPTRQAAIDARNQMGAQQMMVVQAN